MAKARDQKLHVDEFIDFLQGNDGAEEEEGDAWNWQGATDSVVIHRKFREAVGLTKGTFNAVLSRATFDASGDSYVAVQVRSKSSTIKIGFVPADVCFHQRWGTNVVASEAELGKWPHLNLATNSYGMYPEGSIGKFATGNAPVVTSGSILGLRVCKGQLFMYDASHGETLLNGALNGLTGSVKLLVILGSAGDKAILEAETPPGAFPPLPNADAVEANFLEPYDYLVFKQYSSPRASCYFKDPQATMLTDNKFRFLDVNPESVVDDVLYVLDRWKNCESAVSEAQTYKNSLSQAAGGDGARYLALVKAWMSNQDAMLLGKIEADELRFEALVQQVLASDAASFEELRNVLADVPSLPEDQTIQTTELRDWTCIFELLGDANLMEKILDRKLSRLFGGAVDVQSKGKSSSHDGISRALRKACFRFGGDVRRLTDFSKKAVICRSPKQMVEVAKALVDDPDIELLSKTNDFMLKEAPLGGYRKISLTVKVFGLPHLSEIEIHAGILHGKINPSLYKKIQNWTSVLSTIVNWVPSTPYEDCCPPGVFFPAREIEKSEEGDSKWYEKREELETSAFYERQLEHLELCYKSSADAKDFTKVVNYRDEIDRVKSLLQTTQLKEAQSEAEAKAAQEKWAADPRFAIKPRPSELGGQIGEFTREYKRMDVQKIAATILAVTQQCGLSDVDVVKALTGANDVAIRRTFSLAQIEAATHAGDAHLALNVALFLSSKLSSSPEQGVAMSAISET